MLWSLTIIEIDLIKQDIRRCCPRKHGQHYMKTNHFRCQLQRGNLLEGVISLIKILQSRNKHSLWRKERLDYQSSLFRPRLCLIKLTKSQPIKPIKSTFSRLIDRDGVEFYFLFYIRKENREKYNSAPSHQSQKICNLTMTMITTFTNRMMSLLSY